MEKKDISFSFCNFLKGFTICVIVDNFTKYLLLFTMSQDFNAIQFNFVDFWLSIVM